MSGTRIQSPPRLARSTAGSCSAGRSSSVSGRTPGISRASTCSRATGSFDGHRLKIWFKNENHLSWLDGNEYVASPDLIEVCDATTGEPLVNTYLEEGSEIAVVGARRRDVWDSEAGLATLGPAHFGWNDFTFRPIESFAGDRA